MYRSKNENHGIQFRHFVVNTWKNNENSDRLYLPGLQNHCRQCPQLWKKKKKETLAPWKKSYEKPYSTLKSRDIILPANVCIVKAMILPEIVSGCESWTIKKAEYQRIDGFKMWCWIRLLRVLGTTRRFNQSMLKEISAEYSLEGPMLKLNLQYLAN